MIAYWSNFIRSGSPNGQGLAVWPAYAKPTDVMQLVPGRGGDRQRRER